MKSLITFLSLMLALAVTGNSYWLEGSWELDLPLGKYKHIKESLTFQFKRQVKQQSRIESTLFIYNCFISQYLYQTSGDQLNFSFVSSSLMGANCSIEQIDQIKKYVSRVSSFRIQYDRLVLSDLARRELMTLRRQKIQYGQILEGVWRLSGSKGSTVVRINSTMISLCQDQVLLTYRIKLINQSYPTLSISTLKQQQCQDARFVEDWANSVFFQVEHNRTTLTVFNFLYQSVFTLSQMATTPNRPPTTKTNNKLNLQSGASQGSSSQGDQQAKSGSQSHPTLTITSVSSLNASHPGGSSLSQTIQTSSTSGGATFSLGGNPSRSSSTTNNNKSPPSSPRTQSSVVPTIQNYQNDNQLPNNELETSTSSSQGNQVGRVPPSSQGIQSGTSFDLSSSPFGGDFQYIPASLNVPFGGFTDFDSGTSQGQKSTNIVIQVPLEEFVLQAKWSIKWMNGLSFIPPKLQRTYLQFNTHTITLYCPCNTYQSPYYLQTNSLRGLSWSGTQNQCSNSQDHLVTGLIFSSNSIQADNNKLGFYFNGQTKLAQFEAFF